MSDIDPFLQGPKGPEKPNLLQDTFKVSQGDAGTRLQDNIRTRLEPSENLTRLLMNYERYEEFVYDPGDNTGTIGYGHVLLPGESYPNGISKKDAGLLLQKDLKERFTAKSLDPFLKEYNIKLTQNQYDALVLFTYNTGEYVWDLDFNLKRMLINGNYTADDIIEGFWDGLRLGTIAVDDGNLADCTDAEWMKPICLTMECTKEMKQDQFLAVMNNR